MDGWGLGGLKYLHMNNLKVKSVQKVLSFGDDHFFLFAEQTPVILRSRKAQGYIIMGRG